MTITKTLTAKIAATVAGVAMVLAFAFSFAVPAHAALSETQIQAIISLLQSFGADSATIANVDASLRGNTPSTPSNPGSGSSTACYNFTRDLTLGATGADVMELQKFLNANGAMVAASGAGSPGNESSYFGGLSQAALAKWQAANGVSPAAGYFGPLTRAAVAAKCSANPGNPGTPTTPAPGSGLSVVAASQPQNAIAPASASRVPFTRFTLTAGNDGAVTVNSVTVQRVGLGANAAFSGVVLLDESGNQLGTSKTLNSNDQATIGEAITIPAGQSRTFTVAANMGSSLGSYAGQVPAFSVVGVNTSATVSGSLPITGAYHTINATLSIGAATVDVSSFDPNTARTREIGTTGYNFSGIRLTAGSQEDVRVRSIRWNQTGSASASDLTNVQVIVDGTAYPAVASSGGKYYTANFGSGILVQEGFSIDMYVRGDLAGSDSAGRTVIFDIDKASDIYVTGETYGYGITPAAGSTASASDSSSQFTTGTPFFDGSKVTIEAGSVTTISKANSVPAQNVAINVPNQPLGGFEVDIKGEALTVQQMDFGFTITGGDNASDLTNVTLVDQNGTVVAGPVDGVASGVGTNGYVRFTDTITLPVGKRTYTLRGRLSTDFANGNTIIASTSPANNWTNVKGELSGNTITLSNTTFNMNTMTVKAAALAISVSGSPVAQNIVSGVQDFTFAQYQLDASASGEDVRFSSIPLKLTLGTMVATEVSSCQLFDGATALNTGSNIVNPSAAGDNTFTLDNALVVTKGTVKTLALKCDISGSVSNSDTISWGISAAPSITVTGVQSSQAVTETVTASNGQTMTVAAASFTITKDNTSPAYGIVAGGSTDVTLGVLRARASNEDLSLTKIALQLTSPAASSSPTNLVGGMVKLYNGINQIGSGVFTSSATTTHITLSSPLSLPRDTDVKITIKGDLSPIGPSSAGTQGALLKVDWDGVGQAGATEAVGSATVTATGSDTAVDGVRIFRSFPTVAKINLGSNTLTTGTVDLYRFSISANDSGSGINLYKLVANVATSSATAANGTTTVTNLKVFAYTDAGFSSIVPGYTDGQIVATIASLVSGENNLALSSVLEIPAGATYYFKVQGQVSQVAGTSGTAGSVSTRIVGDAAYPNLASLMATAANVDAATNDNFIWSPNASGSTAAATADWTNGYQVVGLPSSGTDVTTLTK